MARQTRRPNNLEMERAGPELVYATDETNTVLTCLLYFFRSTKNHCSTHLLTYLLIVLLVLTQHRVLSSRKFQQKFNQDMIYVSNLLSEAVFQIRPWRHKVTVEQRCVKCQTEIDRTILFCKCLLLLHSMAPARTSVDWLYN